MRRIVTGKKDIYSENNGVGMRKMICLAAYIVLLTGCIILSGCTRREQLVLETGRDDEAVQSVPDKVQGSEDNLQLSTEQPEDDSRITQELASSAQKEQQPQTMQEPQTICVHVCGAVKNPDVYELPVGSRVYEAVKKAGGFSEEADESYVNQAQTLQDGVKLVIPTREQTQAMLPEDADGNIGIVGTTGTEQNAVGQDSSGIAGTVSGLDAASDGKININTATEAQLCNIPGIGATRAAAIVAYRQEKGAFTSIEDIMNVSGIKEGTYAKIKDSIKVN